MHGSIRSLVLAIGIGWLLPAPAVAQAGAVLRGEVREAGTGVPIAGAEILVTGPESARAVAGPDGSWRIGPVAAGRYEIAVRHIGFAGEERPVEVGGVGPVRLDVVLTPRPLALDAVVVTASRRSQRLADVPVATELVGRTEIQESGASELSAILTERTGIALEGGHPVGAGIMLQGLGSERVLVLLDGQPFIGRIAGRLDLSRIPTAMIERVEVVKGPQSTLYGSEAMGGVVNVITRTPMTGVWSGGLELTGGSQGRLDLGAHLLGGDGPLAYTADLGRRTVDLVPGQAGETGALARRWDALAKLRWQPSRSLSLSASALGLDERQRWRTGQLYNFADNRQWGARLGAAWSRGAHRVVPTLFASEFRHASRRAATPDPVAGTGDEERHRLIEAELLYGHESDRLAVDAGIEARREAIVSDRVAGAERTHHTLEPFVQTSISGERWTLVPGVRLAWSEQWGTHWTPRLAAMVRPTPELALRGSVGLGYRAPDFKELHMEFLNTGPGFGYVVRGNPGLRPETSRNATLGVEWAGDRVYLRAQAFHNRFVDFIETSVAGDSSGLSLYTYGNIDDGITRGAEFEAGTTWRAVRLEGGYAYLVAEHGGTGEPLLGRPTHSGRGSLSVAAPFGLRASLSGVYTGAAPVRRTEAGVVERAGFTRFDLRAAQALPLGIEIAAGVDNALDTRPDEWPGFMGRRVYVTVGWTGRRDAR